MQRIKGFTLIELLVVIAIIAILAAIIFPVFANARDKAHQISDLSNTKQIALALVQYTGDYDDTYPIGEAPSTNYWGNASETCNWMTEIAPYAGGISIFYGPNDTEASQPSDSSVWGVKTSYGVNALDGYNLTVSTNSSNPLYRLGVFGATTPLWNGASGTTSYANSVVAKESDITKPSETILIADLQSSDVDKVTTTANVTWGFEAGIGNASGFAAPSLIGNLMTCYWCGSSSYSAFNMGSSYNSYCQNQSWDVAPSASWGGGAWAIPNPNRPATAAYPLGPSGYISTPFVNKSLANFAFADGHSKSLKPASTNPDGYIGAYDTSGNPILDPNNQWIASR